MTFHLSPPLTAHVCLIPSNMLCECTAVIGHGFPQAEVSEGHLHRSDRFDSLLKLRQWP